jgi:hypothetical protein
MLCTLFVLLISPLYSQIDLGYYLPDNISYNPAITTPKQALGFEIGEWHLSPAQNLAYLQLLEKQSDRLTMLNIGQSYEQRPTVLLIITSPGNQQKLDQIQAERQKLTDPDLSKTLNIGEMLGVIWLGYSIHGDEASGSNAAALVAYYLAAGQSTEIENLLRNTVVLIEPFINPDGLHRFATWVNMHKGKNLVNDPNHREHRQGWPSARTNHYWFDLNRDWMPAQHPETIGRLQYIYQWLPNILTDHHEMGTNATFYFQPGIKSRNNPVVPERTYDLTAKIARYHAKALDHVGSLYFTEEIFDDYYIGKGSTFTDIIGTIGILFEQASVRGHLQESVNGEISFPFAIKNQFTASLSSMQAALEMRQELNQHQKTFFKEAYALAEKNQNVAYVVGSVDRHRNHALKELLINHHIEVYLLNTDSKIDNYNFKKERDFVIPLKQKQYRLILSLFEERTVFPDSLFYDISTWNLAHSFNLSFARIKSQSTLNNLKGSSVERESLPTGKIVSDGTPYAYLMRWDCYNSARALNRFLQNDIICKVAEKSFEIEIQNKKESFEAGTILIPMAIQKKDPAAVDSLIEKIATADGLYIFGVSTGYSEKGIRLGSFNFGALKKINPLLVVGEGISSNEAGEVWHLLDQRLDMTCSMVDINRFNQMDLSRYNVVLLVNGNYARIDSAGIAHLKHWIEFGGILISTRSANRWLKQAKLAKIDFKEGEKVNKDTVTVRRKYSDARYFRGAQAIGGSLFAADLDLSHPLGYGFEKNTLPVFKRSQLFIKQTPNPYNTPLLFKEKSLLSGYISDENYELLAGSAAISIYDLGNGRIISFSENPNFRAILYGTNRLFINALMFGQIIRNIDY